MLTGALSLSRADMFGDGIYVGPEVQYFGSDGYRYTRFGADLTGLKTDTYPKPRPPQALA